jgi:hypothetical protein
MNKLQFAQVAKWVGIVDGAVIAAAITVGKSYPPFAPYVVDVTQFAAGVSTFLGVYGHLTAGTNAGKNFVETPPVPSKPV